MDRVGLRIELEPGWDAMALALGQAGVRPDEVTMLIPSHAHTDHRGLAAEFVHRTGARLATSAEPHPLLDVIRDPAIGLEIRRDRARREGVPEFAVDAVVDELPGIDGVYPTPSPTSCSSPGRRSGHTSAPGRCWRSPATGPIRSGCSTAGSDTC